MAARPSKFPRWATTPTPDPTYGGNNIFEPAESKKDTGWFMEYPAGNIQNWFMNLTYQWLLYHDDIREQLPLFNAILALPATDPEIYEVDLGNRFTILDDTVFIRVRFDTTNLKTVKLKFTDISGTPEKFLTGGREFNNIGAGELEPDIEYLIAFNSGLDKLLIVNDRILEEILTNSYLGSIGGTASALTLNPIRTINAYVDGMTFIAKMTLTTNNDNATLNISSLGAKKILARGVGGAEEQISEGHLYQNYSYWFVYDSSADSSAGAFRLRTIDIASTTDMAARTSKSTAVSPYLFDQAQATESLKGIAPIATTAEAKAGTNDTKMMTAKKVHEVNVVHQSTAAIWANFKTYSGGALNDSYNILSIADIGAGRIKLNFNITMSNTNFCVVGGGAITGGNKNIPLVEDRATTYIYVYSVDASFNTQASIDFMCIAIFGDRP